MVHVRTRCAVVAEVVIIATTRCCQQRVLDFPNRRLRADTELEVLFGDAVPVLVDHHDREKHADGEEEEAIDVVLDGVADSYAEGEEDDLSNSKEGGAEDDVANRPAVIERAQDEDELQHNVNDDADSGPDEVDDIERDRVGVGEPGEGFEGGDGDEERDTEESQTAQPQQLEL